MNKNENSKGIVEEKGGSLIRLLFPLLSREVRLSFGSKWMNWHGRLLIGSPEKLGLLIHDLKSEVSRTFYFLRIDRNMPTGSTELNHWRNSQLLATQIREMGKPYVARNTVVITMLFCLVMLALTAPKPIYQEIKSDISAWIDKKDTTQEGIKEAVKKQEEKKEVIEVDTPYGKAKFGGN